MNRWIVRSAQILGLAFGGLLITGTAAQADWTTGYNAGVLNGNQSSTTIQVPVNVCGNAVAVMGFANADCNGGAYANANGNWSGAGSWDNGNGGGNANANGVGSGHRRHHHNGGAAANAMGYGNGMGSGSGAGAGAWANANSGDWTTGFNAGVLNGNQSSTTIQMPVNVCGNAIAVLGFASAHCG
jgi:hypothetical protein